jgi:hypothetical protein
MAPVTNAKEFAMFETMAPKDLEELMERVRHWPEQRQQDAAEVLLEMERQDSSGYRLTDAQAREVARIQREISEGKQCSQLTSRWRHSGSRAVCEAALRRRRESTSQRFTAISGIATLLLPHRSSHTSDWQPSD